LGRGLTGFLLALQLYSEFAEPLELLEIVLLIFHVSDHRDPFLVSATWEAILARGALGRGSSEQQVGADSFSTSTVQEANPDRPLDVLSVKVADLGRRFHGSDVAFPLGPLRSNLTITPS
jgi:nuclear pore complex protein Nup155